MKPELKIVPKKSIDRSPHNPKVSPFVDDPIPPERSDLFRRVMGFHLRQTTER